MENNLLEEEYLKVQRELKKYINTKQDIIYHYTSPDGLKGIIKDIKFWFTDIKFLNDCSEDNYVFTLSKKVALSAQDKLDRDFLLLSINIAEQYLKNGLCMTIQTDTMNIIIEKNFYFIASFSLNNDSLELWRNYTKTQNSVGYNIAFQNLIFEIPYVNAKFDFGKVIYDKDNQINILRNFIWGMNECYLKNKIKILRDKNSLKSFIDGYIKTMEYLNIFFKHPAFVNEEEYRYVLYDIPQLIKEKLQDNKNHSKEQKNNFISPKEIRIKDGVFIPYIEAKFNLSSITSIGISPNINSELLIEGVKRSFLLAGIERIRVWASEIPFRQ